MRATVFFADLVYIFTTATIIGAQTCYYPSGAEAANDIPCRAAQSEQSGQASACCGRFDVCLDNSLCLSQVENGNVIMRGTCTDHSWQSGACAQYCQDVDPIHGVTLFPFQDAASFCCGPGNSTSGTCIHSTQGSVDPFPLPAGRVIFNRTSGSTAPNVSDSSTITTVSTTTVALSSTMASTTISPQPFDNTTCPDTHSSCTKPAAVGVGVGVPCGLALLGALGLLWRQRSRDLGKTKEVEAWKRKYDEIVEQKRAKLTGAKDYTHELEHWRPDEIDGRLVHEASGRT